jgi:transposase
MRLYQASRRQQFERLDQPRMRPLPATPFEFAEWKLARVNVDYHVEVRGHYYSVPFALVHEAVDVRFTATTVEIFHRGQRVAAHRREHTRGTHTTIAAHMPKAHQAHAEWTPSRILAWAQDIGPETHALADAILRDRPHPEQGYRSCLGLYRLARRYGPARLEAACARARVVGARSYRQVDAMLKHGLDRAPLPEQTPLVATPAIIHEHVRGAAYYK